MLAHLTLSRFLVLLFVISTLYLANSSDSETLLEFKDSLSNGDKLTTWNTKNSPCNNNRANWEGIICTNGTVLGIELEGKGLQGNIDTSILVKLLSLESINFKNNNLDGFFPIFEELGGLQDIILSNNKLSGEIPTNAFKGLKWLKKLYLANNELVGPIPFSLVTLPKLKELTLQNNEFEGDIPKFDRSNLTVINLANNHLHGRIPKGLQDFPASQFSGNEHLCGTPLGECRSHTSIIMIIIIAFAMTIAMAAVISAVLILCCCEQRGPSEIPATAANLRKLEKGGRSADSNGKKVEMSTKLTFLRDDMESFGLPELLKASVELLGSGIFGASYKADFKSGKVMVVKKFKKMNNVGKEEFYAHMRRLGRLQHPNILSLVAFNYKIEEKLLVTEYIDNFSLSYNIHSSQCNGIQRPDWPIRLKIVKGVAKGLLNLYNELSSQILPHGHLKSSNVLLTRNYEPLLTNYGLVPVTNPEHAHEVMMAYKSPEYKQLGRVSKKTDIWCFGILILEVMTGKFVANNQGKGNDADLIEFVNSVVDQELNIDVFDKEMRGFDKRNEGEMVKLLKIGLSCCETEVDKRIDIKQVVDRIEDVKEKDS